MKVTKIILAAALVMMSTRSMAQDCPLPVRIQLDEDFTNAPQAAVNNLRQSLTRIATDNGFATSSPATPFVLTAHCDVLDKSNLPGPPVQTVYNIGLTLYMADAYAQQKFATAYIKLDGVGTGEVKSYINAFKRINSNSKEVQRLIVEGKRKMLEYYDTQYAKIIKEAERLEHTQQYEEALALVMAIPVCSKGGEAATSYGLRLYQTHLDRVNQFLLNSAKAAWAAGQDKTAAYDVCAILAQIDPAAACYAEASQLMAEVKSQVHSDIDFEMRQKYNDQITLEQQRIEAARAVGVAFGNGQKEKTTNLMWMK